MSQNVDWQRFFQRLESGIVDQPISENEVLSVVRNSRETIYCLDLDPTYTLSAVENRVGFALVGYSEVG